MLLCVALEEMGIYRRKDGMCW